MLPRKRKLKTLIVIVVVLVSSSVYNYSSLLYGIPESDIVYFP